jgi:hypothetical protein
MEIPFLAERVPLDGHEQPFFVIVVDEEHQTVELMPVRGRGPFLGGVPFGSLRRGAGRDEAPPCTGSAKVIS